jgi:RHS repeat-associated protein
LFLLVAHIPARAQAQSIAGEPGGGIPESGSLSLANALAAVALDPSTGVLTTSLPLETPAARGVPQPGLALTYNSAAGIREAGVGWGLNVPSIERRNRDGAPQYHDPSSVAIDAAAIQAMDRFVFNGKPLVPICLVTNYWTFDGDCFAGKSNVVVKASQLPAWATDGWIYFRLETDDSRARFFWSPDRHTWRVQFVGGEILELGVPLARPQIFAGAADAAIDYDAVRIGNAPVTRHALRWNAVRRFDQHERGGAPANLVAYRWARMGSRERGYLTDVWDTPPADAQDVLVPADFAHHVRLTWDAPPFLRGLAMPGFRATPDLRLVGIDVTSQPFAKSTRQLLRRYHIGYVSEGNRYYLTKYETEGRCAPIDELADGSLPATQCRRLPATRLRYSQREYATRTGEIALPSPPPHAPGKPIPVTVLDVNGDSLPDFIETKDTTTPGTSQRLYLNGRDGYFAPPVAITGPANLFSRVGRTVTGSINVVLNGPGAALWHATQAHVQGGFPIGTWGGGDIVTASQDPGGAWTWSNQVPVDVYGDDYLVGNSFDATFNPVPPSVVGDVDGDGLADGVFFRDVSGTVPANYPPNWKQYAEMTTISLGAFAHYSRGTLASYVYPTLRLHSFFGPSPETVSSFDWPDGGRVASLVDMNGDGLGDLAFITRTQKADGRTFLGVRYWPGDGRGNFTACTADVCAWTDGGRDAHSITFPSFEISPVVAAQLSSNEVALADVNGDGFADLVVATPNGVNIYWNADGRYWGSLTEPNLSFPASQVWANWGANWPPRIQFADMNGNGLTDVVFIVGDEIVFLDVQNFSQLSGYGPSTPPAWAPRPGLLIGIDNGLGASTDVQYIATTDLARKKGTSEHPWATPQAMQVVKTVTVTSGLPGDERRTVTYDYDNPAFDGHERRFRGFRNVSATRTVGTGTVRVDDTYFIGDADSTWHTPLLVASEVSDGHGLYHSTKVLSYLVQDVMPGAFGAGASHSAYPERVDTILYDTAAWSPSDGTTPVTVAGKGSEILWSGTVPVRSRINARIRMEQQLDDVGNVVWHVDRGQVKDDGRRVDEPIVRTVVMNAPRGDWRFLPKSVTVAPFSGALDLPRQRRFEYDALGQLTKVFATLTGTLPLDRFHEDPLKQVAGAPSSASRDGEILIARTEYDDFGNVTLVEGSNGHCATTDFDRDYASLAQRNVAFSGGCGKGGLPSETKWDRGFATSTFASRADGTASRIDLDDFGRVVATHVSDPVTGAPSAAPSSRIEYQVAEGGPVQRVKVESSEGGGRTHTTWRYVDSLGRAMLTLDQADPSAGDEGQWVVSGMPRRSGGLVKAVYEPWFYSGDPASHPLAPLTSISTQYEHEPFGRVRAVHALDGTLTHQRVYRALGVEDIDAAGRVTVTTLNGHGRIVRSAVRTPGDELRTRFVYEVDGEVASILQTHSADGMVVQRWFQYDSLGRNVLNVEPNTSTPFVGVISQPHAWRYAYDDAGQLVGTSDARGCGKNIVYDGLGRPVAEDFSPCLSSQEDYSPADITTGEGAEVLRTYDAPETGQTTDLGVSASYLKGRLTATRDRGAHTRFGYDARGRIVSVARQIARPAGQSSFALGDASYEAHWSRTSRTYDEADRIVQETTGAEVPELLGAGGQSAVAADYTLRGFTRSIGGSYGPLLAGEVHAADGLTTSTQYADTARTSATFEYDARRRSSRYALSRPTAGPWATTPGYMPPTPGPSTLQQVPLDTTFSYDAVGNPKLIDDKRDAAEWPTGFTPVTRTLQYDALDRIARVDYAYAGGPDIQVDPFTFERANGRSPVPASVTPNRVAWQTFDYDWLGNLTKTEDDVSLFYDRSLGAIAHGSYDAGPNQIRGAGPNLSATHDAAGNLTDVVVQRPGPCTDAAGCIQRFHYDWDEVGQLARARRWDFTSINDVPAPPALPAGNLAADLRYLYDESGARVLKTSLATAGETHYTAEIFPALRLEHASWDDVAERYTRTPTTEVVYLAGLARVVHGPTLPSATQSPQHVFLLLPDHLGSTTAVIDRDTSELVERTSQQVYGAPDSDYRPGRWAGFREPYQFTGKEDDFEVGLTYFGARYYHAALGRFASADPLTIHAMGADANPYAYVSGSPLARIDPDGLDGFCIGGPECSEGTPPPVYVEPGGGSGDSSGGTPSTSGGGGGSGKGGVTPVSPSPHNPSNPAPSATSVLTTGLTSAAGTQQPTTSVLTTGLTSAAGTQQPTWFETQLKQAVGLTLVFAGAHRGPLYDPSAPTPLQVYLDEAIATVSFEQQAALMMGPVAVVSQGKAGSFASLDAGAVVGDAITPHHMPQAALRFTSYGEGGALAMEAGEHVMTRTYGSLGRVTAREAAGMAFRDVLARDMRDVRQIVGPKYDPGLRQLLRYYYDNFPILMKR